MLSMDRSFRWGRREERELDARGDAAGGGELQATSVEISPPASRAALVDRAIASPRGWFACLFLAWAVEASGWVRIRASTAPLMPRFEPPARPRRPPCYGLCRAPLGRP